MSIVDYIEDLPDVKEYQATFCITLKVSGEDEADAIQEAWEKFQSRVQDSIETEETWYDNFELKLEEV